jgi:hypothetical protein
MRVAGKIEPIRREERRSAISQAGGVIRARIASSPDERFDMQDAARRAGYRVGLLSEALGSGAPGV